MYFYKERFKVAHMKKHGGLMKTHKPKLAKWKEIASFQVTI